MTGPVLRLLTLVVTMAALLILGLHSMGPARADADAGPSMQMTHDGGSSGGATGPACAIQCLASALLPAGPVPVMARMPRSVPTPGVSVRLAGLSPLPAGPPPKALASS